MVCQVTKFSRFVEMLKLKQSCLLCPGLGQRALMSHLSFSGRSEEMMTYCYQNVVRAQLLPNQAEVVSRHLMLAKNRYWRNHPRARCYHLLYHLEATEMRKR
ncbi:unnamed protein product [Lymnaea stagnalis]|uniref:Uncharacterized protein n=1 Tax=Lymnaea stagnalis TaxID=6523 RepID=A0AAV2HTM8_LYMST